jgi:ABC-type nitrate/sulfonate/bicarbonate transport system permease component
VSGRVVDRRQPVGRVLHGRLPRTLLVLAVMFGVWQWVSSAEMLDPFLFPPPTTVASDTIDALFEPPSPALGSEGLIFHVLASLRRAALGWVFGGAVGIVFGLVTQWWSGIVSETGNAMLELLRPIPIILMLPMLVVIIGIGDTARVVVIASSVFVVVAINTMYGVRGARGSLLNDVARSFGAGQVMTLRKVVVGKALPQIMAGLRQGVAVALILMVASELILANDGVGWFMNITRTSFKTSLTYGTIIIVGLLGLGCSWLFAKLERLLLRSYPKSD